MKDLLSGILFTLHLQITSADCHHVCSRHICRLSDIWNPSAQTPDLTSMTRSEWQYMRRNIYNLMSYIRDYQAYVRSNCVICGRNGGRVNLEGCSFRNETSITLTSNMATNLISDYNNLELVYVFVNRTSTDNRRPPFFMDPNAIEDKLEKIMVKIRNLMCKIYTLIRSHTDIATGFLNNGRNVGFAPRDSIARRLIRGYTCFESVLRYLDGMAARYVSYAQ